MKITLTLIALGAIFMVGASLVSALVPGFWSAVDIGWSIGMMIGMSLLYAFIIIGGLSYLDNRDKPPTEKTLLEGVLGVGSGAFKPKPRSDAAGGFFFGIIFALVLLTPFIQNVLTAEFLFFLNVFVVLMFFEALVNLVFFLYGENPVNLVLEALSSGAWIVFAMFLINIAFPVTGFYQNTNGVWNIVTIEDLIQMAPELEFLLPFNYIWAFIVFIIVITNLWKVLMSAMKIPMYRQAGKGWWFKGEWGQKRWKKYKKKDRRPASTTREDGYSSPNY